ncbi:unnamed protein product [Dicrocoelium dendriticum]|nr:unnamed protein product [Dicrocoelium dendriticum]
MDQSDANKGPELRVLASDFNLYLKPVCRVCLTVQLPHLHDSSGRVKSFTTWEIIEKLRQLCPSVLSTPAPIRFSKTTLEFVRFIAEVESKAEVKRVVTSLDSQYIKLSGFPQNLHVRANEAPTDCPRRHDWEAFFRDADMDETQPGERPDTIVISGLPVRWFAQVGQLCGFDPKDRGPLPDYKADRPSASIVKSVFETYGPVRYVDIPMLDPVQNPSYLDEYLDEIYNTRGSRKRLSPDVIHQAVDKEETSGFGKIGPDTISVINADVNSVSKISDNFVSATPSSLSSEKNLKPTLSPLTFTAYVQFKDYTSFTKAMEGFRGQKLVYAPRHMPKQTLSEDTTGGRLYFTAEIKIDFDRSKHLSRSSIDARRVERERLVQAAKRRREEERAAAEAEAERRRLLEDARRKTEERRRAEALALEAEQEAKRAAKAERKKHRAIERCRRERESLIKQKIMLDERRRLLAVRKAEAIRLITFLITRVQQRHDALVSRRRAVRLECAERAAAEAEASLSETLRQNSHPHDPPASTNQPTGVSSRPVGLPDPSDSAESSSDDAELENRRNAMLEQLLKKREEHLRAMLLKKRTEAMYKQSVGSSYSKHIKCSTASLSRGRTNTTSSSVLH